MNDDPAEEYARHMPRAPTEQLVELLREHHPEHEIAGWAERNTRPEPPIEVEPITPPAPMPAVVIPQRKLPRRRRAFMAPTSAQAVINAVAIEHDVSVDDLIGRGRDRHLAHVRHIAMVRLRATGLSLEKIGRVLGGRDHTTIIHGIRAHAQRVGGAVVQPFPAPQASQHDATAESPDICPAGRHLSLDQRGQDRGMWPQAWPG